MSDEHHHRKLGLFRLAILFFLLSMPKTLLLSLIPVQGLRILGDAQAVSVLYFLVSMIGVVFSVTAPALARRVQARGVFFCGAVAMLVSVPLLGFDNPALFSTGMVLHVLGFTSMEIGLIILVMLKVPRRELNLFEPKRVICSGSAFMIGPWLGAYLKNEVAYWLPFAIAFVFVGVAVLYLISLDLHRVNRNEESPKSSNPVRHVKRFMVQPRMRLAWVLTAGRNGWWNMYFIYVPIYCVTVGLGEVMGGVLLSSGVGLVLSVPIWAWLGRRYGIRRLIFWSALATSTTMFVLAAVAGMPWLGAALWLASAAAATPMDGAGNIPFLRAVRPRERAEMTGVFMTTRDAANVLPPGMFSVLLKFFELPAIFVASGVGMLGVAWLSGYLPKRM